MFLTGRNVPHKVRNLSKRSTNRSRERTADNEDTKTVHRPAATTVVCFANTCSVQVVQMVLELRDGEADRPAHSQ